MQGQLTGYTYNRDGTSNITITVEVDFAEEYESLRKGPVEISIKKAVKHRSLEANRYAWVLIDQIAVKTNRTRSEVYRHAIREIGGVSQDMMIKTAAIPLFTQIWEAKGLGNQIELVDTEEETGWSSIRIFYGSSTYDTAQMSALLDSLIQEAEAQGIPTITPKEEARMLGKWAQRREKQNEQEHHAE